MKKIQKAKSLIGKRVANQSLFGVATSWELHFDNKAFGSYVVAAKVKRDGYCVAVCFDHYMSPVDDIEEYVSKEFVLNKEYTAIVSKETVKVGCQTFDSKVVLEMAEYIKTL